jgi:hypothetical protein
VVRVDSAISNQVIGLSLSNSPSSDLTCHSASQCIARCAQTRPTRVKLHRLTNLDTVAANVASRLFPGAHFDLVVSKMRKLLSTILNCRA